MEHMARMIRLRFRTRKRAAKDLARRVEMILMDVDGTLTDGTVTVLPDGEEIKSYNVRDGLGLLLAQMAGLRLGIVTGKTSKSVELRAEKLKIFEVHQGVLDKKKVLLEIMDQYALAPEQVAYIGDDLSDVEAMKLVGLAAAVADAHPEVRKNAHFICRTAGGRGAVREFIEFILDAQGRWADLKTRSHQIRDYNI
jgi:YrbI family 3-deoxy-D-manno-octulosonate 8-phosphate phosphatase